MGVLDQYGQSALKYWGAILASAEQHLNIADMWAAIRDAQQQYGLPAPGASAPDVMVLRGYANRLVNGENALAAANPSDAITREMMGVGPYTSNTVAGLAANPTYQVRFESTTQAPDGTVTSNWYTSVFTAVDMPQTTGGLFDVISGNADELAAGYGSGEVTGVANLSITVV